MSITNKVKTGIALPPECIKLMDRHMQDCRCYSRNELVQKAIEHYVRSNIGREYDEYFNNNDDSKTAKAIQELATRLARIDFKIAVQLAQLNMFFAHALQLSWEDSEYYKGKAVQLVKSTKGIVELKDILNPNDLEEE
ncbi:MAG: hypothetical protein M0R40_05960 [Firmicutes bacterium]|nr:hypothetical protein [Bacillota bacterium]